MQYLITQKMRRDYEKQTGIAWDSKRRTGRSTAIALRTIANAIASPGLPQTFTDHEQSHLADLNLADIISDMIHVLNLRGLQLNKTNRTLTFHLYEPACTRCRCSACEE